MLRPPLHMDHQSSRSILYDRDALPDIKSPPKRSLNGAPSGMEFRPGPPADFATTTLGILGVLRYDVTDQ
jgi:hypothetical protein